MILDKNGKLFGKISIVDILVILIVAVGIAGAALTVSYINNEKVVSDGSKMLLSAESHSNKMEIGLKLYGVRDVTRDAIVVGDEVYSTKTDDLIGVIKRIDSEPSKQNVVTDNGEVVNTVIPEKFDVTIIVETTGKKTDTGYYTDTGVHILYGKDYEIKTSTIKSTPLVSSVAITD